MHVSRAVAGTMVREWAGRDQHSEQGNNKQRKVCREQPQSLPHRKQVSRRAVKTINEYTSVECITNASYPRDISLILANDLAKIF